MPISSLVITLQSTDTPALAAIRGEPRLQLGELAGRQLPAVMETDTEAESQTLHDWLGDLPGVDFVDVVAVFFDEPREENG